MTLGPGSDYNRIENNRFKESRTNGIIIGNPSEPDQWNRFNTITGNMIHTNSAGNMRQYDAVVAYDAHNTIFSRNQVSSWYPPTTQHRSALVLGRGCDTWIVTGNIMRHNSAAAIIAAEDRATSSRTTWSIRSPGARSDTLRAFYFSPTNSRTCRTLLTSA